MSLTQNIPNDSDLARKLRTELRGRVRATLRRTDDYRKQWEEAENKTLAFLPTREVDAKRKTNRDNGLPQYTTIQIPYTYSVLMSAHTYFASVFMGRSPILQYTARHGESAQQVQAIEALHDYQMLVGNMLGPLYTWLYDAGKYGIGVMGSYWDKRMEMVSNIEQRPRLDPIMGEPILDAKGEPTFDKVKVTRRIPAYEGNCIYNLQPWDFIFDVRFPVKEFQRGEYCGMRRLVSWNELKKREAQGYYMNLDKINRSYTPKSELGTQQGSDELNRPDSQENWSGMDINEAFEAKNPLTVRLYELYVELIPKTWGLGNSDYPEKWVFTVTEDFAVLIGAQPHGAYHCKYPFHVLSLEPEAYGLITRGMPKTLEPVQNTIDWLINSHFYNVRAALNNKFIVDPSRLVMKDVLDPLPGGIIRMKQEAYGQDVATAIKQFPVQDVTQNHLRDLQMMYGVGERTVGVNDQIMGMLSTGGRKTATEVRTSTSFGVNRLKTISEYFSATGWSPLSATLLSNTQQYYTAEKKFRIAGDLTMSAGRGFIDVTPDGIAGFYDFVPVDGALPIDRYAQANLWKEMMGQMRQVPEIAMQYDFGRMFEWVAQLAGMKNITQFKVQVVPDEQLLQQARMGNVVPMGGNRAPARIRAANQMEPAQVPGNGPTG